MSLNYKSENTFPVIKNFNATPSWLEVFLPSKCKHVTIGSDESALYVSFYGTDGVPINAEPRFFISKDGYISLNLGRGTNQQTKIYVATKASSLGKVTLVMEE